MLTAAANAADPASSVLLYKNIFVVVSNVLRTFSMLLTPKHKLCIIGEGVLCIGIRQPHEMTIHEK
jgi:hypothetical protein